MKMQKPPMKLKIRLPKIDPAEMITYRGETMSVGEAYRRQQSSRALMGKKKERVVCPHCGKEGGVNVMPRFHFDNCKSKP